MGNHERRKGFLLLRFKVSVRIQSITAYLFNKKSVTASSTCIYGTRAMVADSRATVAFKSHRQRKNLTTEPTLYQKINRYYWPWPVAYDSKWFPRVTFTLFLLGMSLNTSPLEFGRQNRESKRYVIYMNVENLAYMRENSVHNRFLSVSERNRILDWCSHAW